MRLFALWLGLLSLFFQPPAHALGEELVVGVQPYQSTRSLIADHRKLAAHLGSVLQRPVRIVTAKDVTVFGRRILAGDYDLVIGPGHLVRLAQQDQGWHPLARYIADTPVLLLARKGDVDFTVASLKGRTLATPGRNRLVSLAAEEALASQHVLSKRDYSLLEANSVGSAVHALAIGKADMAVAALASLNEVRGTELEQLRIVQEITTVPLLFFAARPDMPPAMRTRLQRALLAYQTPQGIRTTQLVEHDLAAMDVYLEQTRRLLHQGTPPIKRAAK